MRWLALFGLLAAAAMAVAFVMLNAAAIKIDIHVARFSAPLGMVLLVTLAAGWLFGGLTAWLGKQRQSRRRRLREKAGATTGRTAAEAAPP